jgi:tetratricopeptide (TPR) repeat protein
MVKRWMWWALPLVVGVGVFLRGAPMVDIAKKASVDVAPKEQKITPVVLDEPKQDASDPEEQVKEHAKDNDAAKQGAADISDAADDTAKDIKISTAGKPPVIMQQGIGNYLAARIAFQERDMATATQYFRDAISQNPHDWNLKRDALQAYILAGDMAQADKLAKEFTQAGDVFQIAHLLETVYNFKQGKMKPAADALAKLEPKGFLLVSKPLLEAWLEVAQNKQVPKIAVNAKIRQSAYFDGFMMSQKALMHDVLGDKDHAREYYEGSVQDPKNVSYYTLLNYMDFLVRSGEVAKAKTAFQAWGLVNAENDIVQYIAIDQLLAEMHERVKAANSASPKKPIAPTAQDGMAELMFATASMLHDGGESVAAVQIYLRLALVLRPDFPKAQLLMGLLLEEQKQFKQALSAYDAITHDVALLHWAMTRRAFVLDELGNMPEAMKTLETLALQYPKKSESYVAKGDILRKHDKFVEAAGVYSQAIQAVGKITEQHWPLFFVRGVSYERSGKWDLAEKDLRKALQLSPNQPDVLNYLGYSLVIEGTHLAEAKDMLQRAIKGRPEDPHILDSMGWAYYVLGEYKQSVTYLEQAAELMPADATVNDHLGDAMWRMGRKHEARFQWQRALTFNPDAKTKVDLENKLQEGLPVIKPQAKR